MNQDNSRSSGILADDDIINAEKYFWRKGTEEVKRFVRAENTVASQPTMTVS